MSGLGRYFVFCAIGVKCSMLVKEELIKVEIYKKIDIIENK